MQTTEIFYVLQKDLPDAKAGQIYRWYESTGGYGICRRLEKSYEDSLMSTLKRELVENNLEWFKPINLNNVADYMNNYISELQKKQKRENISASFSQDEVLIAEAILHGRKIQEYIWQDISLLKKNYDPEVWSYVFQKRVDKIKEINTENNRMIIELRKRVLQQAALSILALKVLDNHK